MNDTMTTIAPRLGWHSLFSRNTRQPVKGVQSFIGIRSLCSPRRICIALALIVGGNVAIAATVEDKLQKNYSVTAGGQLLVQVDRGSIEVKTTGGDRVEVEATRTVKDVSQAAGDKVLKEHEITINQDGNQVSVQAKFPTSGIRVGNDPRNRLQVKYFISVPKKFNVDLKTAGGSIKTADLVGNARCQTAAGNLTLGKIDGPVWAKTSGGSITVAACTGNADVDTAAGNIQLGAVSGAVNAHTSGGSIAIDQSKGKVLAKTSAGNIDVGEVLNDIEAQTAGGSIRIKKASGKVVARTSAGNITLDDVNGAIEANTDGGSITAAMAGRPEEGSHLKTASGNIKMSLSEKAGVDLDAQTSAGQVRSELSVSGSANKQKTVLKGKINGGGPALVLQTSAGSISISKL
jgi:hypothetical protein